MRNARCSEQVGLPLWTLLAFEVWMRLLTTWTHSAAARPGAVSAATTQSFVRVLIAG